MAAETHSQVVASASQDNVADRCQTHQLRHAGGHAIETRPPFDSRCFPPCTTPHWSSSQCYDEDTVPSPDQCSGGIRRRPARALPGPAGQQLPEDAEHQWQLEARLRARLGL